jgi:hypothetical protein
VWGHLEVFHLIGNGSEDLFMSNIVEERKLLFYTTHTALPLLIYLNISVDHFSLCHIKNQNQVQTS